MNGSPFFAAYRNGCSWISSSNCGLESATSAFYLGNPITRLTLIERFDLKFKFVLGWVCGHQARTSGDIVSCWPPIQNQENYKQLRAYPSPTAFLVQRTLWESSR